MKKKTFLISYKIFEWIFLSWMCFVMGGLFYPGLSDSTAGTDLAFIDEIFAFVVFILPLLMVLKNLGWYSINDERIIRYIFPLSVSKVNYSDYEEAGLITTMEYGTPTGRGVKKVKTVWIYTHYIYFSPKPLTDEERSSYSYLVNNDCVVWQYNKKLHTYLTDTLGIELEGKLTEKEK